MQARDRLGGVLRRFCSPRWLAFHLLALVLIATFLGLGWWQLQRASSGNALSWGYTLEWPAFAAFTGFVWFRTLRDSVRPPQAPAAERAPRPEPAGPARLPVAVVVEGEDPELAEYNRYLAALAEADHRRR